MKRSRRSRLRAFTLVELMVATVVSVILVGVLLSITQAVLTSYDRVQGSVTRGGDAALAIDQMILDLEGMIVPDAPGTEALRVTPESVAGTDNAGSWLTFLTTTTDEDPTDHTGATRAVSYRLDFQNVIDGSDENPAFALYRSIASAKHTFEHAVGDADHQANYWVNLDDGVTPAPGEPTAIGNYLSGNIVGLQVRFLRADNGTWTSPGDTVRVASDGITVNGAAIDGGFTRVEVALTALTSTGAERLANDLIDYDTAVNQHGTTVVRQTASFLGGR